MASEQLRFAGERVVLPWPRWAHVAISPAGLHTAKGLIRVDQLELLQWKAAFYERQRAHNVPEPPDYLR